MRAHQRLLNAATSLAQSHAAALAGRDALGAVTDSCLSRATLHCLTGPALQRGRSGVPSCARHFAVAEAAVSTAGGAAAAAALSASRAAGVASTSGRSASLPELVQLYKQLSKFRLSALVVSTAAAGFIAGAPPLCLTSPRYPRQGTGPPLCAAGSSHACAWFWLWRASIPVLSCPCRQRRADTVAAAGLDLAGHLCLRGVRERAEPALRGEERRTDGAHQAAPAAAGETFAAACAHLRCRHGRGRHRHPGCAGGGHHLLSSAHCMQCLSPASRSLP